MNDRSDRTVLQRAADRASERPFFLGRLLTEFRSLHEFGEHELAEWLGCPDDALPRLALCRRPDSASPDFRLDVESIAEYSGASAARLAQLIREVDSIISLRRTPVGGDGLAGHGLMMAARDHSPPPDGKHEKETPGEQDGNEGDD